LSVEISTVDHSYRRAARWLAVAVCAACVAVLIGWGDDASPVKDAGDGLAAMQGHVAFALLLLLLLGAALVLVSMTGKRARGVGRVTALSVAAFGALNLLEFLTGRNLDIQHMLLRASVVRQPAPGAAAGLLLTGLALATLDRGSRRFLSPSQGLSLLSGLGATYVLLDTFLEPSAATAVRMAGNGMAVRTAVALTALDIGIWLLRPREGVMAVVTSPNGGGKLARWSLPAMAVLLLALGWLRVFGPGHLGTVAGAQALATLANIVAMSMLLLFAARSLSATDAARMAADAGKRAKAEELAVIAAELAATAAAKAVVEEDRRVKAEELAVTAAELAATAAKLVVTAAELRRVARMNELILQHMPGGLSVVDKDNHSLIFNAAAQTLMRHGPGGADVGLVRDRPEAPFHGIIAASDGVTPIPTAELPTARALRGETVTDVTYCVLHEDGARTWLSATATPLLDAAGEVEAAIVMFHDITDRLTAEAELARANAVLARRGIVLEHKNEEVEAFVYAVSHDMRSPLVTIQGFVGELVTSLDELKALLAHSALPSELGTRIRVILDEDIAGSLSFITAGTDKFERLINALLKLSRVGRRELKREPLDMEHLVDGTLAALRGQVVASGATVQRSALPPASGDVTAIGQVFANLISNALTYLQAGRPGVLEIGGESGGNDNHYWVRDNGIGIPEGARGRLFQVFQRFHPEVAPGEGMGLSVAKRLVERHGGRIWAESVPGKGTTMHFSLPNKVPPGEREDKIDDNQPTA
jgi:signal transduction histidine kinase